MAYAADPGGNFTSDVHRRVLCAVPRAASVETVPEEFPIPFDAIMGRLDNDPHTPLGTTQEEEVLTVLEELQADGYVKKTKEGYQQTETGNTALSAPPPEGT